MHGLCSRDRGWATPAAQRGKPPLATHTVPPRQRWYLDPGGTAGNSQDHKPRPGQPCRISHSLVCPVWTAPTLHRG
ncbi:DUF6083 domain-containing protein [Streptomyces sp. NPDC005525]|uniref:DUF6083 domain-containing protein n=1 Tax=Streptomyces sp. NPDC005525 TaxID=3364720 RepID=UPI0036935722